MRKMLMMGVVLAALTNPARSDEAPFFMQGEKVWNQFFITTIGEAINRKAKVEPYSDGQSVGWRESYVDGANKARISIDVFLANGRTFAVKHLCIAHAEGGSAVCSSNLGYQWIETPDGLQTNIKDLPWKKDPAKVAFD
jgi:hypothetical protein